MSSPGRQADIVTEGNHLKRDRFREHKARQTDRQTVKCQKNKTLKWICKHYDIVKSWTWIGKQLHSIDPRWHVLTVPRERRREMERGTQRMLLMWVKINFHFLYLHKFEYMSKHNTIRTWATTTTCSSFLSYAYLFRMDAGENGCLWYVPHYKCPGCKIVLRYKANH